MLQYTATHDPFVVAPDFRGRVNKGGHPMGHGCCACSPLFQPTSYPGRPIQLSTPSHKPLVPPRNHHSIVAESWRHISPNTSRIFNVYMSNSVSRQKRSSPTRTRLRRPSKMP